jgi:membrane-associated phospholipid phosphatase
METAAAEPAVVSPLPSLSHIFTSTVDDVRRLPSHDTLTWLSIGVAASAIAHAGDARVTRSLSGSNRLDGMFESGSMIGGLSVQLGGAFATYAAGRLMGSPRAATIGADLVRAQLLSQAVTQAIKLSARRTRPDGGSFSFPSGHTSITFASATVLQRHLGWKAGIPAYAVATYVAASRIQEHRHFLSDVVFGAAIGIVAGRTVTVGRNDARFAVGPMATTGGGGVGWGGGTFFAHPAAARPAANTTITSICICRNPLTPAS